MPTEKMESEVVLTLAPPMVPQPVAEQGCGLLRSCWLRIWGALKDAFGNPSTRNPKPSKDKKSPQYTISVPCHGRYRRLPPAWFEGIFKILAVALLITSITAPYLIIYALTGFQSRQATYQQTFFTMHWLSLGQLYGLSVNEFERHTRKSTWITILLIVLVLYGWAAVGGSVVVIKEMTEFGTCSTW